MRTPRQSKKGAFKVLGVATVMEAKGPRVYRVVRADDGSFRVDRKGEAAAQFKAVAWSKFEHKMFEYVAEKMQPLVFSYREGI